MVAVANVIDNRATQDFSNYGSSAATQAVASGQFQGWQAPSQQALQIAQQMQNGDDRGRHHLDLHGLCRARFAATRQFRGQATNA
jgi:Cell Wall Hydrolase